jgi:hypothetical protein
MRNVRNVCLVAVVMAIGAAVAFRSCGSAGFSQAPRIGETADAVIERLGQPGFDSRRADGETTEDYRLGYIDGLGTRHHLHVKDGVIAEIQYSSR